MPCITGEMHVDCLSWGVTTWTEKIQYYEKMMFMILKYSFLSVFSIMLCHVFLLVLWGIFFVHSVDQPHNPMLNSGALLLCALQKVNIILGIGGWNYKLDIIMSAIDHL